MKSQPTSNTVADNIQTIVQVDHISSANRLGVGNKGYHYHNCYQLVIIERGNAEFMINCMLQKIEQNTALMVGNDLPHGILNLSDDIKATIIHIPHTSLMWCANIPELEQYFQFIQNSRFGYRFSSPVLVRRIIAISRKIKSSLGFAKVHHLFEMLDALSKDTSITHLLTNPHLDTDASFTKYQTATERAFSFLYQHFQESVSLEEVAKYANQNASSLCRAFKNKSGCSIFQFANKLRIEKACQLLHNKDLSIEQIAFQVGFNTFSHFSAQFKKATHTSPTEYRKKVCL